MPDNVTKPWTPFQFDGNSYIGLVDSPEKWREVVEAYKKVHNDKNDAKCIDFLRNRAKELSGSVEKYGVQIFGFYSEYDGPLNFDVPDPDSSALYSIEQAIHL